MGDFKLLPLPVRDKNLEPKNGKFLSRKNSESFFKTFTNELKNSESKDNPQIKKHKHPLKANYSLLKEGVSKGKFIQLKIEGRKNPEGKEKKVENGVSFLKRKKGTNQASNLQKNIGTFFLLKNPYEGYLHKQPLAEGKLKKLSQKAITNLINYKNKKGLISKLNLLKAKTVKEKTTFDKNLPILELQKDYKKFQFQSMLDKIGRHKEDLKNYSHSSKGISSNISLNWNVFSNSKNWKVIKTAKPLGVNDLIYQKAKKVFSIKIPLDESTVLKIKSIKNNFYAQILTTAERVNLLLQNLNSLTQQIANLGFSSTVIKIQTAGGGSSNSGNFGKRNESGEGNNKNKNVVSGKNKNSFNGNSFVSFSFYL